MTSAVTKITALAITLLVVACTDAQAAAPDLFSVGQQDRHSTGAFSAPGADDATVYIATAPDLGTDGRFLEENIEGYVFLTDDEIANGGWLSSDQLDPGDYYVMLRASDYDCFGEPSCIEGFSDVLPLTVPKPEQRFTPRVRRVYGTLSLRLTIAPLGEPQSYRVCWRQANGRRKCLRSTVHAYDWNQTEYDELTVSARARRAMRRMTTFVWYVDGKLVAAKSARIR
jgi:hypothetical protein